MPKTVFCKHAKMGVARFSANVFRWIKKVFPSLDQRNLVCSNRIINNWSTAYPNLPKLDIFSKKWSFNAKNVQFWQIWIGWRSVIDYPIWVSRQSDNFYKIMPGVRILKGKKLCWNHQMCLLMINQPQTKWYLDIDCLSLSSMISVYLWWWLSVTLMMSNSPRSVY